MAITGNDLTARFFENQLWHILILATLALLFRCIYDLLAPGGGQWLALTSRQWYLIAIFTPLVHQPYIWLSWRSELYFKTLSRFLGRYAFEYFAAGFLILIFIRFFAIVAVCFADYHSLGLALTTRCFLSFIIHLPAIYAAYSVIRYFGFRRTPGEDHFKPEEYRNKKLVRQGMYKYTSNVMYVYLPLIFVALAVLCGSVAGLLVSLYTYATVWTHYFCTEKPDLQYIYQQQ